MNITVHHDNKLYRLNYIADAHRVHEGVFQIKNEDNEILDITDKQLYDAIDELFNSIRNKSG